MGSSAFSLKPRKMNSAWIFLLSKSVSGFSDHADRTTVNQVARSWHGRNGDVLGIAKPKSGVRGVAPLQKDNHEILSCDCPLCCVAGANFMRASNLAPIIFRAPSRPPGDNACDGARKRTNVRKRRDRPLRVFFLE